ncbi:unnamed protein product [Closterium sp. Naga37s-1]|nr:unnamed protein product [Closterium sp. Naga37s-1]
MDAGHVAADVVRAAEAAVLAWWATAATWVKWPVAIFLPLFAVVNILFGAATAADLAPLWLLGPLLLSASLRLSHSLLQLSLTLLNRTAPQRQLLLTHATDLAGYLRSGNVPEDVRKLLGKVQEEVEEKRRSALSVVQERRAALVVYVNSGRMAEDVQSKAERWAVARWEELCDWTIVRAEDASDWLRVTQRRLGKVVEKVF